VSITGSNFSTSPAPQAVLSNGTDTIDLLNVQAPLNLRLDATVPQGLDVGTYDLTVTNPDGEQATLPNAFTVLGSAPEIAGVLPFWG
jgi:hypothetical protein